MDTSATSATRVSQPVNPPRLRLGAAIWSQLFLRIAQSAGVLVIGALLTDLHNRGENVNSLLVGGISLLPNLTEFFCAPLAGALSDRRGRKTFLIAGPALSCVGVLFPLGALGFALPPLGLVLTLLALTRLVEGIGSGVAAPATLGFLAEGTDGDALRRGRQMSLFELSASGGIALGAVMGPLLYTLLGLYAFAVLALLYLIATLVVLRVREGQRPTATSTGAFRLAHVLTLLANRRLALFLPAWVAANAILGIWVTAQIEYILTTSTHVPGQQFVGSLSGPGGAGRLSLLLGGYVLWFTLCVVVWAIILGRLPKLPTLLVTLSGSIVACGGLVALNHGGSLLAFVPVVLFGVLLEAGFTPTALAYLADVSQTVAENRDILMGVYSVILGAGYVIGNALGAVFASFAYFDGLAYLTMLLAAVGIAALTAQLLLQRRADAS